MFSDKKIARISDSNEIKTLYQNETIVLCFGQFNVIHPGHMRYLMFARSQGTKLIVALEGDVNLSNLDKLNTFPELSRAEALGSLELVDYVVILDRGNLNDLVEVFSPVALVLGKEYERDDLDKERRDKVSLAVETLEKKGGQIIYESGETHYATGDLFRASQFELGEERWQQFKKALNNQNIDLSVALRVLDGAKERRLLVLGDTIVDCYIACDPIGMSSEAPVIVVKELESKRFLGGAAIVAAHVAALGSKCHYVSVVGQDNEAEFVRARLSETGVESRLIEDNSRPTSFKTRYLVESQKLFRVSRLNEHSLSKLVEDELIEELHKLAPSLDGVLISDFVYGVVTPKILAELKALAVKYRIPIFGDLQCSSQIGDVSKFTEFTMISPTEREARIALNNQDDGVEHIANVLIDETGVKNLVLKLGAAGVIAYSNQEAEAVRSREHFPALNVNPIDVTGAGDSMLAAMAVALCCGSSLMEAVALGCCMSALSVEMVGNVPISLERLHLYLRSKGI